MILDRRALLAVATTAAVSVPLYQSGVELPGLGVVAQGFAVATAAVLRQLGFEVTLRALQLTSPTGFAVEVTSQCTAWPHALILVAGLVAAGARRRPPWWAIAAGLAALAWVNVARLVVVFAVGQRSPEAFFWAHRIIGEAMLVGTVVALWWACRWQATPSAPAVERVPAA